MKQSFAPKPVTSINIPLTSTTHSHVIARQTRNTRPPIILRVVKSRVMAMVAVKAVVKSRVMAMFPVVAMVKSRALAIHHVAVMFYVMAKCCEK